MAMSYTVVSSCLSRETLVRICASRGVLDGSDRPSSRRSVFADRLGGLHGVARL